MKKERKTYKKGFEDAYKRIKKDYIAKMGYVIGPKTQFHFNNSLIIYNTSNESLFLSGFPSGTLVLQYLEKEKSV